MNEQKQREFVNSLYDKYGIQDEAKRQYAMEAFSSDFDGALNAFYQKYNPEKEIDMEYFGQIRDTYFKQTPIEQLQPIEEAPDGFFANLRNGLGNLDESIANSFWLGLNFVDRTIDNAFDVAIESITGIEQSGASANTEFFLNRIQQNNQRMSPTKGIIDSVEEGDLGAAAAGVINTSVDFARSIVSGVATMGALPIIEQSESMYIDALERKAQETGKNPLQLIIDDEDDELEPLLYGALAGAMERIGLKGVTKYITSMPKDAKSKVFKFFYTNAKEGGTEWGQEVLSFINEERAAGRSIDEALLKAADRGFSREGAEVFTAGFLGAAGIGAAGRGIKKAIAGKDEDTTKAKTEEVELTSEEIQAIEEAEADKEAEDEAWIAASETVDTGDTDIDQLVDNTLREAEEAANVVSMEKAQEEALAEKTKLAEKEVKEKEKLEKKKAKAQEKVDAESTKEISRTVRDRATLKKALYSLFGASEANKEDVEEINTFTNFFDGIIGARAKREGISKREWYLSRFAPMTSTKDGEGKIQSTFLEDGRIIISALGKASPREFFQEFSKVIQKDLTETESAALEAEFGIDFRTDLSEESFKTFARAFESYMESSQVSPDIKGNNSSLIKAAFEKISQWMQDIKASIEGESSLHVNSNVRKIFDSIVTAKEIEREETVTEPTTETEADRDVELDRPAIGAEQGAVDESGEARTEGEVVDLTETQETIEEPIKEVETKTVELDEQETKKSGDKGVLPAPKGKRPKTQADTRGRRDKAFSAAQKDFQPKPEGGVKGGEKSLDKAISMLDEISDDKEQPESARKRAEKEASRLREVKRRSEENKKASQEKAGKLNEIKEAASKDGFSTGGLEKFSKKEGIFVDQYEDGEVFYLDTRTGETGTFSLSENKLFKETEKDFKGKSGKIRRKVEREKREEKKKLDKESENSVKNANSLENKIIKSQGKALLDHVNSILNKVKSIDFDLLVENAGKEDTSLYKLSERLFSYMNNIPEILSVFKGKHAKTRIANAKKILKIIEPVREIISYNNSLLEQGKFAPLDKAQIEVLELKFLDHEREANLILEQYEAQKEAQETKKKSTPKALKGTIYDDSDTVHGLGIPGTRKGRDVVGFLRDLISSFKTDGRIMVVDLSYFTDNSRFRESKLNEERTGKREAVILKIATAYYESRSASSDLTMEQAIDETREMLYDIARDDSSNAFHISLGSAGSIIGYKSNKLSDLELMNTVAHEFGHYLKAHLFSKQSEEVKSAIWNEYMDWLMSKDLNKPIFSTDAAINKSSLDKENALYYASFEEYMAEQIAVWISTNKKAETLAQKFFKGVADALRKLFGRFKEDFKSSKTIDKLLSEHFEFTSDKLSKDSINNISKAKNVASDLFGKIQRAKNIIDEAKDFIDNKKAKSEAQASKLAKEKAVKKEMINEISKDIVGYMNDIKSKFEIYVLEGGVNSDFDSFMAEIEAIHKKRDVTDYVAQAESDARKAKEKASRKVEKNIEKRAKEKEGLTKEEEIAKIEKEIEAGYESNPLDDPMLPIFQKTSKNPRETDKRRVTLEKIAQAIDGKFKNKKEFDDLVKAFSKALEKKGEPVISQKEKEIIQNNTKNGGLATITEPIFKQFKKKRTIEIRNVIDSFSASREEREAALAEADRMVKNGTELSPSEMEKYNKLMLVGLYNTTLDERKKLIDGKVAESVVKKEDSNISRRLKQAQNDRRIIITEAFYESIAGFKKVAEKTYEGIVRGQKVRFKIYDRKETYKPGELVDHGGKIYKVKEDIIEAEDSSFMDKLEYQSSINRHLTVASKNKKTLRKRLAEKLRDMTLSSHGIESLFDMLSTKSEESAFESSISKLVGENGFRKAAINTIKKNMEIENKYIDLAQKVFGIKKKEDVSKRLFETRSEVRVVEFEGPNGKPVKLDMTVGEMMTWYAYLGQPDLKRRFELMKQSTSDPLDSRFWSDSKQEAILKSLNKDEKEFVRGIVQDVMPSIYESLNKAHRAQFGYDLQLIENYFPTNVDMSETPARQTSSLDYEKNISDFLSIVGNSSIKDRRSSSPLVANDFLAQFLKYSNRATHYTEYVEPVKRISLLIENQRYEFSGYISTVFGKDVSEEIKKNLSNIAYGGATNYARSKIADTVRSLSISGAFMANITMIPKQLSSFVALADGMSWRDFSKYYMTLIYNPLKIVNDAREILKMPYMVDRAKKQGRVTYDTYGLALDNISEEINKSGVRKSAEHNLAKFYQIMFKPVAWGDMGAIVMGGAPLYRDLKKKASDMFPGDAERQKEWVEIKFAEKVSRSQQSSDIMDQSTLQTQGSWAQLFTTFMSTPILYGRILSASLRQIQRGVNSKNNDLTIKGLKTAAMYSFIAPLSFQVVSTGGNLLIDALGYGDDEEEDQAMAWKYTISQIMLSFVQHMPIVYPIFQNLIDRTIKDANFEPSLSAPISISTKAVVSLSNLLDDISEGSIDFEDESTQRDINNVLRSAGINYKGIKNLSENWFELLSEGTIEDWRYLLGYSEYSVK